MYMLPEMIDMGLQEGQEWPSDAHKVVAQNVALCNSRVTTRDILTEVCQAIIAIPESDIKTVTWIQLVDKYNVPFVNLS